MNYRGVRSMGLKSFFHNYWKGRWQANFNLITEIESTLPHKVSVAEGKAYMDPPTKYL